MFKYVSWGERGVPGDAGIQAQANDADGPRLPRCETTPEEAQGRSCECDALYACISGLPSGQCEAHHGVTTGGGGAMAPALKVNLTSGLPGRAEAALASCCSCIV